MFIQLQDVDVGDAVSINVQHIVSFRPLEHQASGTKTRVLTSIRDENLDKWLRYDVREEYAEVAKMISDALGASD